MFEKEYKSSMNNSIVPPKNPLSLFSDVYISEGHGSIKKRLMEGFDALGGIQKVVKPGQTVLIKINLVEGHEAITGGITDVYLCERLIELLKEHCDPGQITVAEQTATGNVTKHTFEVNGWVAMCGRQDVALLDLADDETVEVPVQDPLYMKSIVLPKIFLEADVFITLPLLKNHDSVCITGAIKNSFGFPCDTSRRQTHRDTAIEQYITDLATIRAADFAIVDGRIGMEGIAGGSWFDHPRYADRLIMGADPVAVDTVCAHVMMQNPRVRYLQWCEQKGVGNCNLDYINILGMPLEQAKVRFMTPAEEIEESTGGKIRLFDLGSCSQCRAVAQGTLHRYTSEKSLKERVDIVYGPNNWDIPADLAKNCLLVGDCIQERYRGLGTWIPGCPFNRDTYMDALGALNVVCTDCAAVVQEFIANHTEDELAFLRIVAAGRTLYVGRDNKSGDMDSTLCIGECESFYAERLSSRMINGIHNLGMDGKGIRPDMVVHFIRGHEPSQKALEAALDKLKRGRQEVIDIMVQNGKDPQELSSGYTSFKNDWFGKKKD